MKNTGVLFANDCNAERVKAVVGNFHRLGIVNSAITCYDGRKIPAVSIVGRSRQPEYPAGTLLQKRP